MFYEKAVIKNFIKLTSKHLQWSLIFSKDLVQAGNSTKFLTCRCPLWILQILQKRNGCFSIKENILYLIIFLSVVVMMALATKHCWKLLFMWDALLNSHEFFLHYQILHPISITKFLFIYLFFWFIWLLHAVHAIHFVFKKTFIP